MPQPSPPARTSDLPDLPPPAPSAGALAWLRWAIAVLKATTGPNRVAIRRHHAPTGGTESLGTVAIAIGYGAELFYWSLLAALSIFVVGGVLSIWEGIQRLLHPSGIQAGLVGVAVLGLGCLLDGTSWLASVRQLRREATARGVRFRQHLRSTTDTAVTAVFYEDAAALLGNAIALTGLGLHQLLGSPTPDAVAGIVIGLLLAVIGLRLAARNRALLTNRSESPVVLDRIRDLLVADPEVAAVGPVASVYLGPHQLLVTAEIQPLDAISGLRLRQLLGELRGRVTAVIPRAAHVFLTPVVTVEQSPEPTPWDRDYWLRRFPDQEQA